MKTLCLLLLLPGLVLCDGFAAPPPEPAPTTPPPSSPTTIPVPTLPPSPNTTTSSTTTTTSTTLAPNTTTTSTTTVAPDTTTSTTTTTTTAPNTTTTSTTTVAPNTTTTSTTTIAPNTTSTPAPTPTPSPSPTPTPTPEPAAGSWTVRDPLSNVTCVIVNMAIRINVTYSKTDNKTGFAVLNVPKEAHGNGTCGNETQMLMLQWHKDDESYNVLEMFFEKNATEKKFVVHNIKVMLSVNPDDFPNATQGITDLTLFNNRSWFATSLTRSYRCMKSQEVNLFTKNSNETMGMLTVSKVQLEAFHETNSTDFGAIEDCERSTDIVPITVGCALVGLVAVVLIGYLVGRRRSQARGYLSM